MIAGFSDDLHHGGARLAHLWGRLDATQVYHTGGVALLRGAARLVSAATIGRWTGACGLSSLLDTAPLRRLLGRDLPLSGIADGIGKGRLYALAVSATSYRTGTSHTFIQGRAGHPLWHKPGQIAISTRITVDHVHASSAIPVLFPPVALDVEGRRAWFGDGALRLVTPLSPAVRLGADRILAIGIGSRYSMARRTGNESTGDAGTSGNVPRPSLAHVCGVTLNALFLDHLDSDLAHLMRMNDQLRAYRRSRGPGAEPLEVRQPMRIIQPLTLTPSEDPAEIARMHERRMPRTVRLALDTFGAAGVQGADLISFDGAYTRAPLSTLDTVTRTRAALKSKRSCSRLARHQRLIQMCELFAMSSDQPLRLRYALSEFATHGGESFANRDGWGIVFAQSCDAYLFKEPSAASGSPLEQMVASHAPPSRLVMAHVRRATAGEPSLCNTHPFRRTIDGQVRHFAHNGNLPALKDHYQGSASARHCIGDTDSELAFLLLLDRLAALSPTASAADRFAVFTDFCAEMRTFGDANFLYTEGEALYVHAHKRRYEEDGVMGPPRAPGLHMRELSSSQGSWRTKGADLTGTGKSRLLIASVPLDDGPWQDLREGATFLIQAGDVRLRADN